MDIKRSISKKINKLLGTEMVSRPGPQIFNLYNTKYDKTVLISYILSPFRVENQFNHQNYITSHIVAECFSEMGYNVDVVDYFEKNIDVVYEQYDVIFGFGYNFERSFYSPDRSIPRIFFITGAHLDFHNMGSLRSIKDFYALSGLWLPKEANVLDDNHYYSSFNSDLSIILADGYIYEDCKSRSGNEVYSLNNNILGTFSEFEPKTNINRTQGFLFLSGGKLITKGIHILLEVARLRKDLDFYIVVQAINGVLEDYYEDVLKGQTNVFLYQNIRMDSAEMKHIIESCSYSIAPSYVDGLPGGTIEPMSAGLIPIVSQYCGFPKKEFIFEMERLDAKTLNEKIEEVLQLSDSDYLIYSNAVKSYILENFSKDSVKKQLKNILKCRVK